jgi:ATP adenylyltransferase
VTVDPERTITDRGVGDPDHLQRLWTPHRMNYIAEAKVPDSGSASSSEPFSDIPTMSGWWSRAANSSTPC